MKKTKKRGFVAWLLHGSKKRRGVSCRRNHDMTNSYEVLPCSCGGHRVYRCRMMIGKKRCGDVLVAPPIRRECQEH